QRLRTRDRAGRGDAPLPDDRLLDLPLGPLLPPDCGVAEPGHLASDERAADPAQPVLAVANDHHRQPDPAAHRLGTVYVRPVLQRLIAVRRGPQVTMSVEASTMTTHMKPPSCPRPREPSHGWPKIGDDSSLFADWSDKHLLKKAAH